MADLTTPDELVLQNGTPATITEWQALAESLLTPETCVFHRNVEVSARYAWMYKSLPTCFKWAGMAAIASHHVRLALYPFRLDTNRAGYSDISRSLRRRPALLLEDIDTIRMTNNAIFNDIFWAHFAYVTADDGIERLRGLLGPEPSYAPMLAGFESIDEGRRLLERGTAAEADRRSAEDLIWKGNVQLLEHEQRALVQPHFDHLSCAFARLLSLGSATTFEVRGARQELSYFTSFYTSALRGGVPHAVRTRMWPRMTRFDDRWRWIEMSVVPRFRRFDANMSLVDMTLHRIFDAATTYSSKPCVLPAITQIEE